MKVGIRTTGFITAIMFLMLFVACGSDGNDGGGTGGTVIIENATQTIYADDEEGKPINFKTLASWTAQIVENSDASVLNALEDIKATAVMFSWIDIDPESGPAGDNTITVSLQANYSGADRSAKIIITSGTESKDVTVTQKSVTESGEALTYRFIPINPPEDAIDLVHYAQITKSGTVYGYYLDEDMIWKGLVTDGYKYNTVDPPDAIDIWIYGIAESGLIWGEYERSDGTYHSFVKDDDNYTVIEHPDAVYTEIYGITESGLIWGGYERSAGTHHSFVKDGDNYTVIEHPDAIETWINRITESGLIWGDYYDSDWKRYDFVKDGDNYTIIEYPNAIDTWINRITESGLIWGGYERSDETYHSFVKDGDNYTVIEHPDAIIETWINGITESDLIFGSYYDSDWNYHYFVKDRNGYSTIDGYPSDTNYSLYITDSDLIWGCDNNETGSGNVRCFVKTGDSWKPMIYPSEVDHGKRIKDVSDSGRILGEYLDSEDRQHYFILEGFFNAE